MFEILIHRVVHSDETYRANTRHCPAFCAPNNKAHPPTTFLTANNTIRQTQMRLRRRHPQGGQYSKLDVFTLSFIKLCSHLRGILDGYSMWINFYTNYYVICMECYIAMARPKRRCSDLKGITREFFNATRTPSLCASRNRVHPRTTFPQCEQYYPANPNKTPPTKFTWGHTTPSWTKHMHWNGSRVHVDNQITFLLGARNSDSWLPLTQYPANESQTATWSPRLFQEYTDSLPPQAQHHQQWDHHNWEQWAETS